MDITESNVVIVAKYPDYCSVCLKYIEPGEIIKWGRGGNNRHVLCRKRRGEDLLETNLIWW